MATKTPISLTDFLTKSTGETPYRELILGKVAHKATPSAAHCAFVAEILAQLVGHLRQTDAGRAYAGLQFVHRQQEWVAQPDISVVLQPRAATVALSETRPADVLPDFAIEVLSPGDRAGSLLSRIVHYMQAGVQLLWVVDPESEEITTWEPRALPRWVTTGQKLSAAPGLPGFTVNLEELFGRVREA